MQKCSLWHYLGLIRPPRLRRRRLVVVSSSPHRRRKCRARAELRSRLQSSKPRQLLPFNTTPTRAGFNRSGFSQGRERARGEMTAVQVDRRSERVARRLANYHLPATRAGRQIPLTPCHRTGCVCSCWFFSLPYVGLRISGRLSLLSESLESWTMDRYPSWHEQQGKRAIDSLTEDRGQLGWLPVGVLA